jgi:hypothetical protein
MIALCREHHDAADRGVFSKSELHELKKGPHFVDDVRAHFPWAKRNFLVRLGGFYSGGNRSVVNVSSRPLIRFAKDENNLLLLCLELRSSDDTPVLTVSENLFSADPSSLHDLRVNTSGTEVKVWFAERNIGLDLSFARLTLDALNAVLAADRELGRNEARKLSQRLPPEIAKSLPDDTEHDLVGNFVRRWATENCLDDEGKIPFINFRQMRIFSERGAVVIRDGIRADDGPKIVYSGSFDNGGGAINLASFDFLYQVL